MTSKEQFLTENSFNTSNHGIGFDEKMCLVLNVLKGLRIRLAEYPANEHVGKRQKMIALLTGNQR